MHESVCWIHIGSKTLAELTNYEDDFMNIFWRALGKVCFALYNVITINLTIMNADDEEKMEIPQFDEIDFDNYSSWKYLLESFGERSRFCFFICKYNHKIVSIADSKTFNFEDRSFY